MSKQSLNTLKNWFKTDLKPLQVQFWHWMDSFWHKDELIPAATIEGLQGLLDTKVDKKDAVDPDQVGVYDPAKNYVYDPLVAEYVSFSNPASPDPKYTVEGFYRLIQNAPPGETPETHPAHWAYQGTVLGEITINDVVGLREELDWLSENAGGGTIEVDTIPTKNSTKAVSSGGVYKTIKQTFVVESTSDAGVVSTSEAFRVTSIVAETGLIVSVKYANGTDYVIGDPLPAFDKLYFTGDTLNKSFTVIGEIL